MDRKFEVGQKLYYVSNRRYSVCRNEDVEITKVGKIWLTLSNGKRASIESLEVDGGEYSSPAQCWLSREDYEGHIGLESAWGKFQYDVGYIRNPHPKPSITVENIAQVRKILGI